MTSRAWDIMLSMRMQAQQLQQQLQQQPPAASYKAALQLGEILTQKLIQLDNVHVTGICVMTSLHDIDTVCCASSRRVTNGIWTLYVLVQRVFALVNLPYMSMVSDDFCCIAQMFTGSHADVSECSCRRC